MGPIGEYDYLAPLTTADTNTNITWPPGLITQFRAAFLKNNPGIKWFDDGTLGGINMNATEQEAAQYIQDDRWPYDGYVTKWMASKGIGQGDPITKKYSNRVYYSMAIFRDEAGMTPQPLSAKIFLGTAKPPPPPQGSSSSGTLSTDDYALLQSICKNVNTGTGKSSGLSSGLSSVSSGLSSGLSSAY
jgi:hypothetical protein